MSDKHSARLDGHEIQWHTTHEGIFADAYRLRDDGTFDPDQDHVSSFALDVADLAAHLGLTGDTDPEE